MDTNINARVDRGVALLDEERPGWRNKINPDELDMSDSFHCVLGQIFGDFSTGLDALGVVTGSHYGFDFLYWEVGKYAALRSEWIERL